jgi:iron complex outermembrane receptor protein
VLQKGILKIIFISIQLGLVCNAFSQNEKTCFFGTINGYADHKGIPFARIWVGDGPKILYSDSLGEFRICPAPGQKTKLVFYQLGFDSLAVWLEPGKKKGTFHLKERNQWLDAIDVRGQHRHFESEVVESQTLHEEELERNRGLSLGELATKIAGVQTLQTGPSIFKPVIQGLTGNRIAIVGNGIKLEGQQWGFDHAPEIDPNLSEEVTIVKGAQAIRYGAEAIGGAILLDPGKIQTRGKWEGRSSSAFFTNGRGFFQQGMAQKSFGPGQNHGFRFSGSYKKSGDFSTAKYVLGNTAMEEYGGQVLLKLHSGKWKFEGSGEAFFTRIGIFSGSHISTPEGIRNALSRPDSVNNYSFSYAINRPSQSIFHVTGKGKIEYAASGSHRFQLIFNQQLDQRKEFDVIRRFASCQNCPQLAFELYSGQAELNHKYTGNQTEASSGFVGLLQSNETRGSILVPDFLVRQISAYHIRSWYRGKWAFEAGLRTEFRDQQVFFYPNEKIQAAKNEYWNVMANGGLRYQMGDHWHSKINLQYSSRAPFVNETYSSGVHHGTASFELGDPTLAQEKILNISYSLHHRSEKWEALVNLFETYGNGFIYLSPLGDSIVYTIRGPFPFFKYQASNVNLRGMDASFHYRAFQQLGFFTKGSFLQSWNFSENTYLIFQPANRLEVGAEWESNSNKHGWKWRVRLSPLFVARQNRVPENRDFAPPPPAYWLLSGRVGISGFFSGFPMDLSIEGQNLLNEAYRDYMNRFRYFAYDMGRNIRFRLTVWFGREKQKKQA